MNNPFNPSGKDPRLVELVRKIKASQLFTGTTDADKLTDKQMLFLVLAGLKPAAEIASSHWEKSDDLAVCVADDPVEVQAFLESLGVAFSLTVESNCILAIAAQSQTILDEVHSAADTIENGRLMGFPATATRAFAESGNDALLPLNQAHKLILDIYHDANFANFQVFMLSKDHAQDELKVLKRWYDELQKYNLM